MSSLDTGHSLPGDDSARQALGRRIRWTCYELGITKKALADATGFDERTIWTVIRGGSVRPSTLIRICDHLKIDLKPKERPTSAPEEMGEYSYSTVKSFEGHYLCIRPSFREVGALNAYIIDVFWDEQEAYLRFSESNRVDIEEINSGKAYIPFNLPIINLVSYNCGAVRLMMLSKPDKKGILRGLSTSLKEPRPMSYSPTSSHVVLKKTAEDDNPALGIIHQGHECFDRYKDLLESVTEDFGKFFSLS